MRYFIAFQHPTGTGNVAYVREKPINTIDEVHELEKEIRINNRLGWVVITNVQRFPL